MKLWARSYQPIKPYTYYKFSYKNRFHRAIFAN